MPKTPNMSSQESHMPGLTNEEDNHSQYAMQLASASVLPMVLKAATELGVFEIINRNGPQAQLSAAQIASQLPAQHNPDAPFMLERILRLFASHSILTCSVVTNPHDGQGQSLYGLTPIAQHFVQTQVGGSLTSWLDVVGDKVVINFWYHLKDAVLEGGLPFNRAYGMNASEYIGKDARLSAMQKRATRDFNLKFMEKILEIYKGFDGLESMVDVGGGNGFLLNMIISKYPNIKGINYDLPPVIENSPCYTGIQHVAGDMFESVPKGDAIFMKWISHNWDDEHFLKLLKNCYEALPVGGKLIIVDLVVPEVPEAGVSTRSSYQLDLFMMNWAPVGKERTEKEFESLAKEAGFSHIQVACCAFKFSVVECYKERQGTCTIAIEEDIEMQYVMQLATGSVLPLVFKAAIELGVLQIIQKAGPGALLSPSQITSQLSAENPDAPFLLDRMLRLLASYSILTCSLAPQVHDSQVNRLYGLAPVAEYFIQNKDGGSLTLLLELIQDNGMIDMWYHLKDAVVEGGLPFNRAHGMWASEYVGKDARLGEIFKGSMRDFNVLFMEKVLEVYKGFDGLNSLIDVGGGDGSILNMIIGRYPSIKGINYDLQPVIEKAASHPGIEHIGGDMFESIPKGDAIFMKWILHGWDDKNCLMLLKNCYNALPINGKVIVVDLVMPETPETSLAVKSLFQMEFFMMNLNKVGKERTHKEFESLAKEAGFSNVQVACSAYTFSVMEFHKYA